MPAAQKPQETEQGRTRGKPGRAAEAGFVTGEVVASGHARFLRAQWGRARITLAWGLSGAANTLTDFATLLVL